MIFPLQNNIILVFQIISLPHYAIYVIITINTISISFIFLFNFFEWYCCVIQICTTFFTLIMWIFNAKFFFSEFSYDLYVFLLQCFKILLFFQKQYNSYIWTQCDRITIARRKWFWKTWSYSMEILPYASAWALKLLEFNETNWMNKFRNLKKIEAC